MARGRRRQNESGTGTVPEGNGAWPAPGRGPGRPGDTDPEETRKRILEQARAYFAARGYAEVSMRELAEAAGVNPATIHYHFGSKEQLHRRVLEDVAKVMVARLTAAAFSDRPAVERLQDALGAYMQVLTEHPYVPRLLMRMTLSPGSSLPEWFVREYASKTSVLIPGILMDGMKAGDLRTVDPRFTLIAIISMCLFFHIGYPFFSQVLSKQAVPAAPLSAGPGLQELPRPDPEAVSAYTRHILDLILNGLLERSRKQEEES